jgi:hypothetical protein
MAISTYSQTTLSPLSWPCLSSSSSSLSYLNPKQSRLLCCYLLCFLTWMNPVSTWYLAMMSQMPLQNSTIENRTLATQWTPLTCSGKHLLNLISHNSSSKDCHYLSCSVANFYFLTMRWCTMVQTLLKCSWSSFKSYSSCYFSAHYSLSYKFTNRVCSS